MQLPTFSASRTRPAITQKIQMTVQADWSAAADLTRYDVIGHVDGQYARRTIFLPQQIDKDDLGRQVELQQILGLLASFVATQLGGRTE